MGETTERGYAARIEMLREIAETAPRAQMVPPDGGAWAGKMVAHILSEALRLQALEHAGVPTDADFLRALAARLGDADDRARMLAIADAIDTAGWKELGRLPSAPTPEVPRA